MFLVLCIDAFVSNLKEVTYQVLDVFPYTRDAHAYIKCDLIDYFI